MAKIEIVELAHPFDLFSKRIAAVKLKEPTGYHYAKYGDPRILVHTAAGGGYFVEQPDVINKYLEACIDHDQGSDLIQMLSLEDSMEVKRTLLSFFEEADRSRLARRSTRSSSALA